MKKFTVTSVGCALLLTLPVLRSSGHLCGPAVIEVEQFKTVTYQITADLEESEPSNYSTLQAPDSAIAELISEPAFSSYIAGRFRFEGKALGETTATFEWSYPPEEASGFCQVTIRVIPRQPRRRETSGTTADPVNTYTGELFFTEERELYMPGPMPLYFQRYYGSRLFCEGEVRSSLGNNWMHNYEHRLDRIGDLIVISFFKGLTLEFRKPGADWVLIEPLDTPFQLREDGDDFVLLNPQDWIRYRFDSRGRLREVFDRNGNRHTVEYQVGSEGGETDRIVRVADGLGRELIFETVGFEHLASVADGTGPEARRISFNVAFNRELRSVTDVLGGTTQFTYNDGTAIDLCGANFNHSASLLTAQTEPEGNTPLVVAYDDEGRVAAQFDAFNNEIGLTYGDGATSVEFPQGSTVEHVHDDDGRLAEYSEPSGTTAAFTYDSGGRRAGVTDALGDASGVTYHEPTGRIASRTDASGETITYQYEEQIQDGFSFYNLTAIQYEDGLSMDYTYAANGNLLTSSDRDGRTTTYEYNSRGQVTKVIMPGGGTYTYTYDSAGLLASETVEGATTAYEYDQNFYLTTITHPDGSTREIEYDLAGRTVTDTDELGNTTQYTYDANGNRTGITDGQGREFFLIYDDRDFLVEVVNELGETTGFAYDERGRLSMLTKPGGETMQVGYDADNQPATITDADGNTTTTLFDAEGVPSGIVNPLGHEWTFLTDNLGFVTGTTTPLGHTTSFAYNVLGDLTAVTNTEGESTSYSYDASGLLTKIELPDGSAGMIERDARGHVGSVTDPDGNTWTRAYDDIGRLASTTDPLGRTTSYSYNDMHLPRTVAFPGDLGNMTTTYDARGQATRKEYDSGLTLDYAYDHRGLLESADGVTLAYDDAGRMIACNGQSLTRDAGGRLKTVTYAPGKTVTYEYNSVGLLASVTDWLGGETEFSYDAATQLTGITRPNGSSTAFGYDADGRLISIEEGDGSRAAINLTLDGEGRTVAAIRMVPQMPEMQGMFDEAGLPADHAYQDTTFPYDALGRLLGDDSRSYTWDAASRLTDIDTGSRNISYTYDGLGMRVGATDGAGERHYVVNYAFEMPSVTEIGDGDGPLAHYIYTPNGRLLHRVDAESEARHFYHFDESGHTLFLTDDADTVTDTYGITPYGEVITHNGPTENPFVFSGVRGVMTDDTGLIYMRARYYDPQRGRFLSPDPLITTHPLQINPYQYALGNPIFYSDPTGLGSDQPEIADIFTPGNPSLIVGQTIGQVKKGFESAARNSADEAIKHWRLFPRNTPVPDLSDAATNANRARAVGVLGNVVGFAFSGYGEYSQARSEGKGAVQSAARGGVSGTVSVAVGTANPVVGVVDGLTGGNFSHSIMQGYRVPEALLGNEADGRAYRDAAADGDYGALVQVTDFAGGEYADKGVGGVLSGVTEQGFWDTIDAWGYTLFGDPEPYVMPESVRKRIEERRERQRRESERNNHENEKRSR